jgi:hypothetical protein
LRISKSEPTDLELETKKNSKSTSPKGIFSDSSVNELEEQREHNQILPIISARAWVF